MAVSYFVHYGYGCFLEVGVTAGGGRRADMIGLKINGDIVICEIKSCLADFRTDTKWQEYLRHCNRFYFVLPKLFDNIKLPVGVGVLVPAANGYLRVAKSAARQVMVGRDKRNLVLRLAWRAATHSRRTNPRRQRIYIE